MAIVNSLRAPWHVYTPLGEAATQVKYQILDADPADVQRVVGWYQINPVPGFEVKMVKVIHNPQMGRMFQGRVDLLEQRHNNPAFIAKWALESTSPEEMSQREKIVAIFTKLCEPFVYHACPHVSIAPFWHGTDPALLTSIFTAGFANLATTDAGFFGKGLYNTSDVEYAFQTYSRGALLINFVAVYSIFPVIHGDMEKLKGKGNHQNYDAHFIPVSPADSDNPGEVVFYPCKDSQKHKYTELVVFDSAQVLPRYIVELTSTLTKSPLPVSDLNHFITALLEYQLTIEEGTEEYSVIDQAIGLYGTENRALNDKETVIYNLIRRATAASVAEQKLTFSKKIVQFLKQINPSSPPLQKSISSIPQAHIPSLAIGKNVWERYVGFVDTEPSLPTNIHQILSMPCPIWNGQTVGDTHLLFFVPKLVNGKPFTLNYFGELLTQLNKEGARYGDYLDKIQKEYGALPYVGSRWMLITKGLIPGSQSIDHLNSKTATSYEIPSLLEATVAIVMHYITSGAWLYGEDRHIRCLERLKRYPSVPLVAGGCHGGVHLSHSLGVPFESLGIAVCRKI